MDMRILGGLGAAGLLALFVAHGNDVVAAEREALIEKHALSQPQQAFMDACASNMRHHNVEYAAGADNIDGCACISGKLQQPLSLDETQYYKMASETYEALLKSRQSVDQGMLMSRLSTDIAKANDVSLGQVMTATMDILDSTKACGVRPETARQVEQRESQTQRCENRTAEEHALIRQKLASVGKGYDETTCSHTKLSGS